MDLPRDLPRVPFSGEVYRVSRAGDDPLSIAGSRAVGRRYNPPGEFGALYASLVRETAVAEVARNLQRRGIPIDSISPGDFQAYALRLTLTEVLDLTDSRVLAQLHLSSESMCGDDVAITRQIGAAARSAGYQALLVPSAVRENSRNVVVFADRLDEPIDIISSESVDFAPPKP
ncbi:MAG: RES family NAD+ phosphorylase [Candidatus Acidiferrales bacterium]